MGASLAHRVRHRIGHASSRGRQPTLAEGAGERATSLIGPRGRWQAQDRSMGDAIFSPRKRRPSPSRSMAARQDAREEQESVQGLVAADPRLVQSGSRCDNRSSRFNTSPTCEYPQNLWPRAVGIPRRASSAAMVCGVVMPFASMSAITGASAMALASARCIPTLRPAARASGVATIAVLLRGDPSPSRKRLGSRPQRSSR